MRRFVASVVIAAAFALAAAGSALASPYVRYGVQDDAWLRYGPGTLDSRAATLESLGTDVVRYTFDWRALEPRRGVYDWSSADAVMKALHAHGIAPVVTLWGSPRWANGGRSANWAPTSKWTFAAFAKAAATRYPYVRDWLIWNEPNKAPFLYPACRGVRRGGGRWACHTAPGTARPKGLRAGSRAATALPAGTQAHRCWPA